MDKEIRFFERDEKGKILGVKRTIDLSNKQLLVSIEEYKQKKADTEQEKLVNLRVSELLQEKYDESCGEIEVEILPLLKYEVAILQDITKGLDKKETQDQDADILSKKCLNPSFTFNQWSTPSNEYTSRLKRKIIDEILGISLPEKKKNTDLMNQIKTLILSLIDKKSPLNI